MEEINLNYGPDHPYCRGVEPEMFLKPPHVLFAQMNREGTNRLHWVLLTYLEDEKTYSFQDLNFFLNCTDREYLERCYVCERDLWR